MSLSEIRIVRLECVATLRWLPASHQTLLAVVGAIFRAKGNVAIGNVDDPLTRDSDAMRLAGEVVEDVLGPPNGRLA